MLSFISFWTAAAIVFSDLASSAYYAGGIAGSFLGMLWSRDFPLTTHPCIPVT
jgi:hypothetical protein